MDYAVRKTVDVFVRDTLKGSYPVVVDESFPSFEKVVPFRRASSRPPDDASTRHLTVVAQAAFTEKH
jgi:hypothetical protein